MKFVTRTLILLLCLAGARSAFAEQIRLKDGSIRYGAVVEYTGNYIRLEINGASTLIELTDIESVDLTPAAAVEAHDQGQEGRVHTLRQRIDTQGRLEADYESEIYQIFEAKNYEELESQYSLIAQTPRWERTGGWKSDNYFSALTLNTGWENRAEHHKRLSNAKEWHKQYPESPAAITAHLQMLVATAWAERGSGLSSTVTDEQRAKYKNLLGDAGDLIRKHGDNKMPPTFYAVAMRAAKGLGASPDFRTLLAQISQSHYPTYAPVFAELAVSVMPKWGGSYEAAANTCTLLLGDAESRDTLIAHYHCVMDTKPDITDREFFRFPFNWERVMQGFEHYVDQYQVTEEDWHRMARLSALQGHKDITQTYFAQTSLQWNHFSEPYWIEEKHMERFYNWATSPIDPGVADAIYNAVRDTQFQHALDLYNQYKGYAKQLNAINLHGDSIIHVAAMFEHFELLEIALDYGGDPNLLDAYDDTPLIRAVQSNRLNSVFVLLRHGADPLLDAGGRTAAHPAADAGYVDILKALAGKAPDVLIAKTDRGHTSVHHAISSAQVEATMYMLRQPQVIEYVKNDDAEWPLITYAAYYGQESIVRKLIELGADKAARNKYGESALSLAQRQGYQAIATYLRSIGAPSYAYGSNDPAQQKSIDYFNQGVKAADNRNYQEAIRLYQQSIDINPNYSAAWSSMALARSNMGDPREAIRLIDKAAEINPDNPEYLYWKGRFYLKLGRPDKYRPLFREYVQLAPNAKNAIYLKSTFPHYIDYSLEYRALAGSAGIAGLIGFWIFIRRREKIVSDPK